MDILYPVLIGLTGAVIVLFVFTRLYNLRWAPLLILACWALSHKTIRIPGDTGIVGDLIRVPVVYIACTRCERVRIEVE